MQKNSMKNTAMLFLAALIWGFAFVAQSAGMEYVGPFTFNAVRCIIGAAVLVPVALLYKPENNQKTDTDAEKNQVKCLMAFDKHTLGKAVSYKELSLVCITDENFADGIMKCAEEMEEI